jgi:opacity protein-like surface antigen
MRLLRQALALATVVSFGASRLQAQRPSVGVIIGASFVGSAGSRTLVQADGTVLTGADQDGLHAGVTADFPLHRSPLSLRVDAFYNHLTSADPVFAMAAGQLAPSATTDRTLGLTGSLVLSARHTGITPYARLGTGFFFSHLESSVLTSAGFPVIRHVTADGTGLGFVAGAGLALQPWSGPTVLLDWSYLQALNHTRGVGFMPVSIGVRF